MPSKILTDLAPELLIQILKSSDNFADVTSLSSSSRKMFIVWEMNIDTICEAVLARTIDCFEQACGLLAAQERAEGEEHSVFGYQSAVDRTRWVLEDADLAARALVHFEKHAFYYCSLGADRSFGRDTFSATERTEFLRAHYRASTLATLSKEPLPSGLLSTWNLLDLEQVKDVVEWIVIYGDQDEKLDLGLGYCDHGLGRQATGGRPSLNDWKKVRGSLAYLKMDLYGLQLKTNMERHFRFLFNSFLIYDDCRPDFKYSRGEWLQDLLPLVQQRGIHCNIRYKLSEAWVRLVVEGEIPKHL